MKIVKECPLIINKECHKEYCGWWDGDKDQCAILTIAQSKSNNDVFMR